MSVQNLSDLPRSPSVDVSNVPPAAALMLLDDDGYTTASSFMQLECLNLFGEYMRPIDDTRPLALAAHYRYLRRVQTTPSTDRRLPSTFQPLDASQAWVCFWVVHAMDLLKMDLTEVEAGVIARIRLCQHPQGGFGGGPGQLAHLAPTYAAVMALATLGTERALAVIDRPALRGFLLRLKQADGSFLMHDQGEVDVRGSYCAMAVASLCGLLDNDDGDDDVNELTRNVAEFIGQCQTYEGGVGATPWNEAHGGYTYCGVATIALLKRWDVLDMPALLRWLVNRQMPVEGGFNGRTNKLVDGCYSFWQTAVFPLVGEELLKRRAIDENNDKGDTGSVSMMLDTEALYRYTMDCTEKQTGGFTDRYDRTADYYHTCYGLSGLSLAVHAPTGEGDRALPQSLRILKKQLNKTDAVFNLCSEKVRWARGYFSASSSS